VSEEKRRAVGTFVGTEPHPTETRQSIRASGHKSWASLMAKTVGLFATIAPSCQRFISGKKDIIELSKCHFKTIHITKCSLKDARKG